MSKCNRYDELQTKTIKLNDVTDTYIKILGKSDLRCVHNIINGKNIDIYLDGIKIFNKLQYKTITNYIPVNAKKSHFVAKINNLVIIDIYIDLYADSSFTIVLHGDINNKSTIDILFLIDDVSCSNEYTSHLRFIHTAYNVPNVDVLIFGTKTDFSMEKLINNKKIFNNIYYQSASTYIQVSQPIVNLNILPTNIHSVRHFNFDALDLHLLPGGIYTIFLFGNIDALFILITEDSNNICVL